MKNLSLFTFLLLSTFPQGGVAQKAPWAETAVRDALVGALTGNSERVSSVRSILDEDRSENDGPLTGLDDDIAVLEILASTHTQKEKAEQIQQLAKHLNDPAARERLLDLSKRSNDFRLEQLLRKRRLNRYTSVLNRTWQTTSRVLTGQPSALGVAAVDVARAVTGRSAATVTDKKLAHLADLQAKRSEVGEKDLAKGKRILDRVNTKKERELKNDCQRTIKRAMEDGDWWRVREFSILGKKLWPDDPVFSESLLSAEKKIFNKQPEPGETSHTPTLPDNEEMEVLRRRLVAAQAPRFSSTAVDRKEIQRAEANRRNRTLDYLLFGDTSVSAFSERSAKTAIVHGADAPTALAFLQAAESAFRAATLFFGNDLGVEEAIQTYARVENENPETLGKRDYLKWADLYSKVDQENKAIALLEDKGIHDKRRMKKYRKRWAAGIVKRCRDLPASKERYEALTYVMKNFPDTKAAREAKDLLRETPQSERSLVRVDRRDLKTFRPELSAAGFNLPSQWWDDDPVNGELEKDSLYWDSRGAILWYRISKKSPWRKLEQSPGTRDRIVAVFAKIEDRAIARSLQEGRTTTRRFPLEIEGALGGGAYITPKLVQYDLSDPDDRYYE